MLLLSLIGRFQRGMEAGDQEELFKTAFDFTREAELYAQVIDELVRQATVVCVERGLLLLRVRDEMRMTVAAYQKNYESLVAFSMRKTLRAEQAQDQLRPTIKRLETEKKKLQKDVADVRALLKCSFVLPCLCSCPCPRLSPLLFPDLACAAAAAGALRSG